MKEIYRFIGVKKNRSWRLAPARFILTVFFVLLLIGFILKWLGASYITSEDLAVLVGALFTYMYIYTGRPPRN